MCQENILPIAWPAMPGENDIPEQSRILHHYARLISNGARDLVHYLWNLNATDLAYVVEVGTLWICVAATNCQAASLIWKLLQHRLRNITIIWKNKIPKSISNPLGLFAGRSHGYEDDFLENWPNRPTADFQETWTKIIESEMSRCKMSITVKSDRSSWTKGMILIWKLQRTLHGVPSRPTNLLSSTKVGAGTAMVWTWMVTLFAATKHLLV